MVWLKSPQGDVIHVNLGRSRGRKKRCGFCRCDYRDGRLCDFPVGEGRTCDAEMCENCARTLGSQDTAFGAGFKRLGDTIDVCPIHREACKVVNGVLEVREGFK